MQQERPPDARRDDLASVDRSPTRCPYCHDSIQPDGLEQAVVCGQCLARHHRDCWDGRCGACSATVALGRLDLGVAVAAGDARAPYERLKRALNLAFIAGFLLCIVAALVGVAIFGPGEVEQAGELPPMGALPMMIMSLLTALIALPMIAVNSYDALVRRARDPSTSMLAPLLALAGIVTGGFSAVGYWARWGWQPLPRAQARKAANVKGPT